MDQDVWTEQFEFLDRLLDGGAFSMFTGWQVLRDKFGLPEQDARKVFILWAQTIGDRTMPVSERASLALYLDSKRAA